MKKVPYLVVCGKDDKLMEKVVLAELKEPEIVKHDLGVSRKVFGVFPTRDSVFVVLDSRTGGFASTNFLKGLESVEFKMDQVKLPTASVCYDGGRDALISLGYDGVIRVHSPRKGLLKYSWSAREFLVDQITGGFNPRNWKLFKSSSFVFIVDEKMIVKWYLDDLERKSLCTYQRKGRFREQFERGLSPTEISIDEEHGCLYVVEDEHTICVLDLDLHLLNTISTDEGESILQVLVLSSGEVLIVTRSLPDTKDESQPQPQPSIPMNTAKVFEAGKMKDMKDLSCPTKELFETQREIFSLCECVYDENNAEERELVVIVPCKEDDDHHHQIHQPRRQRLSIERYDATTGLRLSERVLDMYQTTNSTPSVHFIPTISRLGQQMGVNALGESTKDSYVSEKERYTHILSDDMDLLFGDEIPFRTYYHDEEEGSMIYLPRSLFFSNSLLEDDDPKKLKIVMDELGRYRLKVKRSVLLKIVLNLAVEEEEIRTEDVADYYKFFLELGKKRGEMKRVLEILKRKVSNTEDLPSLSALFIDFVRRFETDANLKSLFEDCENKEEEVINKCLDTQLRYDHGFTFEMLNVLKDEWEAKIKGDVRLWYHHMKLLIALESHRIGDVTKLHPDFEGYEDEKEYDIFTKLHLDRVSKINEFTNLVLELQNKDEKVVLHREVLVLKWGHFFGMVKNSMYEERAEVIEKGRLVKEGFEDLETLDAFICYLYLGDHSVCRCSRPIFEFEEDKESSEGTNRCWKCLGSSFCVGEDRAGLRLLLRLWVVADKFGVHELCARCRYEFEKISRKMFGSSGGEKSQEKSNFPDQGTYNPQWGWGMNNSSNWNNTSAVKKEEEDDLIAKTSSEDVVMEWLEEDGWMLEEGFCKEEIRKVIWDLFVKKNKHFRIYVEVSCLRKREKTGMEDQEEEEVEGEDDEE